jgi:hypothetical protein
MKNKRSLIEIYLLKKTKLVSVIFVAENAILLSKKSISSLLPFIMHKQGGVI